MEASNTTAQISNPSTWYAKQPKLRERQKVAAGAASPQRRKAEQERTKQSGEEEAATQNPRRERNFSRWRRLASRGLGWGSSMIGAARVAGLAAIRERDASL